MSDSARHDLFAVVESSYGVTPDASPAFSAIRHVSANPGTQKGINTSEELHSDRQIRDSRHGAKSTTGDIGFELSYSSFDEYLEAILCGTWTPKATMTETTLSALASDNSINDSANGFVTAGFEVGDKVDISGFTGDVANNASRVLTIVAAGKLTFGGTDGDDIVDDAAGESVTIVTQTQNLLAGVTRRSFSVLRHFTDQSSGDKPYHMFTGCEFNSLSLTIPADGLVTGSLSFIGKAQAATADLTALTTPTMGSPNTNNIFDAFTGVLLENDVSISTCTEVSLTLENGMATRFAIGSAETLRPSIGRSTLSGNAIFYFENATLLEKFLDETESSLALTLNDPDSNVYQITLPRIKYNGAPPDVSGEGSITIALPIEALYDVAELSNIKITRTPAIA